MLFDFKDFQPWDPELYITGALGFVRLSHTPLLVLRVHHSFSQITHQRVTSDDFVGFSQHALAVLAEPESSHTASWW